MKVLVFAGSTRQNSYNRRLAKLTSAMVRSSGAEATHIELADFDIPMYNADLEARGTPADVDANYKRMVTVLLDKGTYPAFATHDPAMIEHVLSHRPAKDQFEFQMLYGIRRDLQERLKAEGWRLRLYVPFGDAWYPYFMRRLAERPANVWFVAKSLLR